MNTTTLYNAILIQLLYAVGITLLVYAMPTGFENYYDLWQQQTNIVDLNSTAQKIESSMQEQIDVPTSSGSLASVGMLIWYSGNIFLDLIMNFLFAIPQLLNVILTGVFILVPIDYNAQIQVKLFVNVAVVSFYMISVIVMLLNLRSGGVGLR